MIDPPHIWLPWNRREICQGKECGTASSPPTIRPVILLGGWNGDPHRLGGIAGLFPLPFDPSEPPELPEELVGLVGFVGIEPSESIAIYEACNISQTV